LPPPKIYRGPSTSGEENVEDGVNSIASTNLTNVPVVIVDSDAVAESSMLASDDIDGTSSHSRADPDCEERLSVSAEQLSSTLVDSDDLLSQKDKVTMRYHFGEGAWNTEPQNYCNRAKTRHTVAGGENNESVDRLSGDADADSTVCEHWPKHIVDDSDKSPTALDNIISVPINVLGCSEAAVINGSDCGHLQQQQQGSTAEDAKPPTPLMSDEVGSSSSVHLPAFYKMRQKSYPRFTPAGSFIIPPDEEIYVDLSCPFISKDPGDIGRVQDVSNLPSPPQRPFTIGDNDQTDLLYFSAEDSIASALMQSGQSVRSWKTSTDSEERHSAGEEHLSDSESSKQGSTSPVDVKVEMRDATPRKVLDDIFKRTSGELFSAVLLQC